MQLNTELPDDRQPRACWAFALVGLLLESAAVRVLAAACWLQGLRFEGYSVAVPGSVLITTYRRKAEVPGAGAR